MSRLTMHSMLQDPLCYFMFQSILKKYSLEAIAKLLPLLRKVSVSFYTALYMITRVLAVSMYRSNDETWPWVNIQRTIVRSFQYLIILCSLFTVESVQKSILLKGKQKTFVSLSLSSEKKSRLI